MNIGINASFLRKPGTGIGQVTTNFVRKLVEIHDSRFTIHGKPEFYLYCEEAPKLDFALPENFHVRVFLPPWKRDDLIRKILWEKFLLPKRARADGCEVFWSLYQTPTQFKGPGSRVQGSGIRHVMLVHDLIPKIFPEYLGNSRKRMYWKLTEEGIRSADAILAVSGHTKDDLTDLLGIPVEKVAIAYPGLPPIFERETSEDEVSRVLAKYGLERDGYIYHGGGLEVRKNAETLLTAYAALCAESHEPRVTSHEAPTLVISGKAFPESNPLATPVETIIRKLGLADRVRLLGFVPDADLPALYRGARVFVYPSKYEGFGLPVIEAMSQGTPVISSDAASLPEIAGDAAYFVDPDDRDSLAEAMRKVTFDGMLRQELSEKGKLRAKKFTYDGMVEKFISTL